MTKVKIVDGCSAGSLEHSVNEWLLRAKFDKIVNIQFGTVPGAFSKYVACITYQVDEGKEG